MRPGPAGLPAGLSVTVPGRGARAELGHCGGALHPGAASARPGGDGSPVCGPLHWTHAAAQTQLAAQGRLRRAALIGAGYRPIAVARCSGSGAAFRCQRRRAGPYVRRVAQRSRRHWHGTHQIPLLGSPLGPAPPHRPTTYRDCVQDRAAVWRGIALSPRTVCTVRSARTRGRRVNHALAGLQIPATPWMFLHL